MGGVEPAGAVVLLIKSFFPQNEKKSCLLSDKLPKTNHVPPVLYFIMMVLLLLYTPKHNNNKKLDQKIMKNNPHPTTNCNLSATIPQKKFFLHTLKPKAREMFLF